MSYPICGHLNRTGRYILHPKKMKFIPQIKQKELAEDPSVKFKELHVYK